MKTKLTQRRKKTHFNQTVAERVDELLDTGLWEVEIPGFKTEEDFFQEFERLRNDLDWLRESKTWNNTGFRYGSYCDEPQTREGSALIVSEVITALMEQWTKLANAWVSRAEYRI